MNPIVDDDVDGDDDDSVDDDSDEDEDEELYAELARIRTERAAEKAAAESAKAAAGNPLLGNLAGGAGPAPSGDGDSASDQPSSVSYGVKRRWDDDVVFRNQSKREPKPEVRFVNDTTRNDFHRRFLRRFVRS